MNSLEKILLSSLVAVTMFCGCGPRFDLPPAVEKKVEAKINEGLKTYGEGFLVMPISPCKGDNGKIYHINITGLNPEIDGNKITQDMYIREADKSKIYWYRLTVDINENRVVKMKRSGIGK